MKTLLLLLAASAHVVAAPPEPKFTAQDLDKTVKIGYGVAVADVDGDKLPDILLADAKQFRWYKNPGKRGAEWPRYVLAENLTKQDNVCIAAQDIDGDGKCEVAVGAEWNPGDTVNSGAVFYLVAPTDRTQPWEPVKFPSVEPTTHRMKWLQLSEKEWGLVVVPLHGRGNKNGEGAGVRVLLYRKPPDPKAEWKTELVSDSMHATHNVATYPPDHVNAGALLLAGKEGLSMSKRQDTGKWDGSIWGRSRPGGAGEVRIGTLPNAPELEIFAAAVEPMHGNTLVAYVPRSSADIHFQAPVVLTDKLIQGHALACGDLLGVKSDQIVVGWRGNIPPKPDDKVGIALWTPLDDKGGQWRETLVDDNQTACEDLALADLDGDGKLDIIAAGRATHNLRVLWNDR